MRANRFLDWRRLLLELFLFVDLTIPTRDLRIVAAGQHETVRFLPLRLARPVGFGGVRGSDFGLPGVQCRSEGRI